MTRIVLLTSGQANQVALAHRLSLAADLATIIVSKNVARRPSRRPARAVLNRIANRTVGLPFRRAWYEMLQCYGRRYSHFPDVPRVDVGNVNDPATLAAIDDARPQLVVVSGTNLVSAEVIAATSAHGPMLNLHTGISPYIRGGPNCTNWCLAKGLFHLIGSTVMWIDAGIDSGDLVATERAPLTGRESLGELHLTVMDGAHDLLTRVVAGHGRGQSLPHIRQNSIAEGELFYSSQWSAKWMLRARANFRRDYTPAKIASSVFQESVGQIQLLPFA